MAGVAGILFDVPDVLYDATLWRRWLLTLLARLGVKPSYHEFSRAWEARLADVHRGRREFDEALESLLLDYGLSWAQVDEIQAASRIARTRLEQTARPLVGVTRTLAELAASGLALAAWADAPHSAARLAEQLERLLGVARFDAVVTSFEVEAAQPQAECYEALLSALGIGAGAAVYVGHDAAHLEGARAFGLATVAFNHDAGAAADHYLARFDELVELARTWTIVPRSAAAHPALESAR
jgi:FMN phosphatase YigB (HAD superfamily)